MYVAANVQKITAHKLINTAAYWCKKGRENRRRVFVNKETHTSASLPHVSHKTPATANTV